MYPELIDNKSDGEVTKEVMVEHFPEIKKKHKSLHWEKCSPRAKYDKQKIHTSFTF